MFFYWTFWSWYLYTKLIEVLSFDASHFCRYDRTPVDEAVVKGDSSLIECITRAAPIPEEVENAEANGTIEHDLNMEDA